MTGTYNVVTENMTIRQVAERIKKITDCEIEISNNIEDKRDYRVSAEKINQFGFHPSKDLEYAFEEIKKAFDDEKIKDYKDVRCKNQKLLFSSRFIKSIKFIKFKI